MSSHQKLSEAIDEIVSANQPVHYIYTNGTCAVGKVNDRLKAANVPLLV